MCISCGTRPANQAGHYFPVKGFSHLRFDVTNIHGQCSFCNLYLHGNQAMYRIGLEKKVGLINVKYLEERAQKKEVKKWDRSELEEIINKYKL